MRILDDQKLEVLSESPGLKPDFRLHGLKQQMLLQKGDPLVGATLKLSRGPPLFEKETFLKSG